MIIILLLSSLGFAVSLYGFFVERQLQKNPKYKPMCDISDRASCSKPFQSAYSKLFGISNNIVGMIFYVTILVMALLGFRIVIVLLSAGASAISVWLGYILYFKIKTFCLICTITYGLNIGLLIASVTLL